MTAVCFQGLEALQVDLLQPQGGNVQGGGRGRSSVAQDGMRQDMFPVTLVWWWWWPFCLAEVCSLWKRKQPRGSRADFIYNFPRLQFKASPKSFCYSRNEKTETKTPTCCINTARQSWGYEVEHRVHTLLGGNDADTALE